MFISKEIPTSQGSNMKESRTFAPFIVSTPSSGSTMFRLMLDAHPELAIPPEANFMSRVILKCEMAINPRDCFVETLTSHSEWADFHIKAESLQQRIAELGTFDLGDALRV